MLGKMFGIVYIFAHLLATGVITRQYADFVTRTFLFKTPLLVVMTFMLLLSAFAVRGGVATLAKCSTIFMRQPILTSQLGLCR
jgi:spore germination protein KB